MTLVSHCADRGLSAVPAKLVINTATRPTAAAAAAAAARSCSEKL